MARIIPAFSQFLDDNGEPLINGSLRFLESDSNNTEKPTYSDIAQTLPNTNPVKLSGAGRCPDVYGDGLYNIVSYDESDQQIEQFDPVGVDVAEGAFSAWNSVVIYDAQEIVTGSNGSYYRAITGANQNNDPVTNPANWELIKIIGDWNSVISYSADSAVYGSNGFLYVSRTGSNLNNNPISDTTNWRPGTDGKLPKGADIASATALVLGDDGLFFDVTGTTTITSINTKGVGTQVTLQFDGALTLTHHTTNLILPVAANITTAAGDVGVFYEYAAGDWRCVSYTKANYTPINMKILDIGDWDMVSSANVSVAHGLTKEDIRSVDACIRLDGDGDVYSILSDTGADGVTSSSIQWSTSNISLTRMSPGFFDSTSFDSTSYNRGWITIWYI